MSWRTKLFLLLAIFSVAPVAGLGFWTLDTVTSVFEKATTDGLKGMAVAKREAIDQFTEYRRRDVEHIAGLLSEPLGNLRRTSDTQKPTVQEPQPEQLPELPDAEAVNKTPAGSAPTSRRRKAPPPSPNVPPVKPTASPEEKAGDAAVAAALEAKETEKPKAVVEAERALRETLSLVLADQKDFEELLIIGLQGRVLASTFQGHEDTTAESLEYFESGRKRTYVQPVFLSPITKRLTMVMATPIYSAERREIGVLAARLNLSRFFQLISDTTGLGKTGETIVGKRVESEVVFMAPTRHDADAVLNRTIPLSSDHELPLREGARGISGAGASTDYRHTKVLAAWDYIPSLDWGLVVKMDYDEVMEGVQGTRVRTLLVMLAIVFAALLASVLLSEALVRPLRQLRYAAERISRGDLGVELQIASKDEIGEVATSFERMIAAIRFFREQSRGEGREPDEDSSSESPQRIATRMD